MRKGTAMEGFIREDGTIRPIEHYDDTELRGKIQTNTDNISNLDSRVAELEEHGVEDPKKADKVVNATAGNLASLDAEGNLQDSGEKPSDFAAAAHGHKEIRQTNSDDELALVSATANEDGDLWINLSLREVGEQTKVAKITYDNIDNLNRALATPSSVPENDTTKLITSKAVFGALAEKANYYAGQLTIRNEGQGGFPVDGDQGVEGDLDDFIASTTADAKYHSMVSVYKDSTVAYFPCLISWTESNNTKTVTILVSHYTFTASRNDSQAAQWDQEFTVVNNSSFFEVL